MWRLQRLGGVHYGWVEVDGAGDLVVMHGSGFTDCHIRDHQSNRRSTLRESVAYDFPGDANRLGEDREVFLPFLCDWQFLGLLERSLRLKDCCCCVLEVGLGVGDQSSHWTRLRQVQFSLPSHSTQLVLELLLEAQSRHATFTRTIKPTSEQCPASTASHSELQGATSSTASPSQTRLQWAALPGSPRVHRRDGPGARSSAGVDSLRTFSGGFGLNRRLARP